ncbi:hypothetical protein EB001_21665 [bacterium]|jgi:hypothetical protein|nr:hypothetical protein [bacterium]
MIVSFDFKKFQKTMNNVVDYSYGFIDGIEKGKPKFLEKLGREVIVALGQYIDLNARANPSAMHHVYEWYRTGSPASRLFDIDFVVNKNGLVLFSNFKQSRSMSADATTPFFNKAKIMEQGRTVVIKPKSGSVLAFEDGGQTIFTKKPITVRSPGGDEVQGSYEKVFDEFMVRYFKQSFIRASGLYDYIKKPTAFKKNIRAGAKVGRSKGVSTGFSWIADARIGVE